MVNHDPRALQINLSKNTDDENDEDIDNQDLDMPDDSPDERGPLMETTVSVLNTSLERKVKREEASNARLQNDEGVGNHDQNMPDDSPDERGPPMETTVSVLNLNTSLETKVKREEASNARLKNDEGVGNHNQDMPDDSLDKRGPPMETAVSVLNMQLERKVKRQEEYIVRLKKALAKERRTNRKMLKEKVTLEENLSKVFSPNQLLHLGKVKANGVKWSDDVIKKGIQLRDACGVDGYQLLLSQGQPLPSMRSLRRKGEVVVAASTLVSSPGLDED
ncbi:hypothetical protein Pmani_034146 [Petrolisthes manimaculis]|uniref:Uncharacterized protein n=1 Tax=Petrolisthes manimaculis TaxID=1843537 RepID=A0AAE1NPU6_9EUCA|nr:hypothetical protein Pmani_034146 [Petrolisthes manimaculis]